MYKSIYINDDYDFHFVRVNADGTLSHRIGFNGIISPLSCLSDVIEIYKLIGAFEIVKPVIRERSYGK